MAEPLRPDIDYYLDSNGLMVLTADYLRRRGTCCQSGCRHCPYGFRQEDIAPHNPPNPNTPQ